MTGFEPEIDDTGGDPSTKCAATMGHGGGLVVSILAFCSEDLSLNPPLQLHFSVLCQEKMKIK